MPCKSSKNDDETSVLPGGRLSSAAPVLDSCSSSPVLASTGKGGIVHLGGTV